MMDVTPELIRIFQENGIDLIPEDATDSKTPIPCVTYYEQNNADNVVGDTLGYSDVSYMLQLWGYDMAGLMKTRGVVDSIMKSAGFRRSTFNHQTIDGLHRYILGYERLIREIF